MSEEIKPEFPKRYGARASALCLHRPWFIYKAASELDQPFTLDALAGAIEDQVGIRPQHEKLLETCRSLYEEHEIALMSRVRPGDDAFAVNPYLDADDPGFDASMRPPATRRGPHDRASATETGRRERAYDTRYHRSRRRLRTLLPDAFHSQEPGRVSALPLDRISDYLYQETGIRFSDRVIEAEIWAHNKSGPPYIEKVEPGRYRLVDQPSTSTSDDSSARADGEQGN